MRGCLFIVLAGVIALVLIVVVGLPRVAEGLVTGGITAAGLEADDTTVNVESDPPTDLVGLHADRVRVRATDARFRGLDIGSLDLTLRDVAILDRTVSEVDGRLREVTVPNVGARELTLDEVAVSGPGDDITAVSTVPGREIELLLGDAVEDALGVRPDRTRIEAPDRVIVEAAGIRARGRLAATPDGDLVVQVTDGPVAGDDLVLLRGGEDLPIRIRTVEVTPDGNLRVEGQLTVGLLG